MKRRSIAAWLLLALATPPLAGAESPAPVTPDATPEARAVLKYLHSLRGEKTLSGQMWAPWGPDEIERVHTITGKLPALRGHDYIHDRDIPRENELLVEWWREGGLPTLMWHWGAPTKGEGYRQSKMAIDIDRCFVEGTEEHAAMWADLERIADHLTVLRDAGVPILWRPMHECDGNWFWYGKGGGERFVRLWRTMFDYFAKERQLNNLVWVLCHTKRVDPAWDPGKAYYDLAGADDYGGGVQAEMYRRVEAHYGGDLPIPLHECGEVPDPDESFESGVPWSWWMLWHTWHVERHDPAALKHAYLHERVITRDELPDLKELARTP